MSKRRLQSKVHPRKSVYFMPGQFMLLVEHDEPLPENLIAQIQQTAPIASNWKRLEGAQWNDARVLAFQHLNVRGDLPPEEQTEQKRFIPSNAHRQAFDPALPVHRRATRQAFALVFVDIPRYGRKRRHLLLKLLKEINDQIAEMTRPDAPTEAADITLRGASPNWLLHPSPDNAGTGGPGARPAPAMQEGRDFTFAFPSNEDLEQRLQAGAQGRGVEVAILDTVPAEDALREAHRRWVDEQDVPHPLLKQLLSPQGGFRLDVPDGLRVTYSADLGVVLPQPHELRVRDHDYPMNDHGLFAAGIVKTIAPQAELHLVQVLNEHGVGTLESIGSGLLWLAQERARADVPKPLVINLSLTMTTPLEGHPRTGMSRWSLFRKKSNYLKQPWYEMMALSLEWICAALRGPNVALVAAAGNDNDAEDRGRGQAWVQARYPAAFPTVLGIGALLENSLEPAPYSNFSDQPGGAGIATFGGQDQNKVAVERHGILGVYIGPYPTQKQDPATDPGQEYATSSNSSGWAWWAGTSFATPIISGVLAALASAGQGLPEAEAVLDLDVSRTRTPMGGGLQVQQGN